MRILHDRWMPPVLVLAGLYNLLWGSAVVLLPAWTWEWSGMAWADRPLTYPQLWQCIGMIVGVYGIGYLVAATDPVRHWPIVLVGFLGKVFGPIGYVQGVVQGEVPWQAIRTILFNDLIWWVPFFLILRRAWQVFYTDRALPPHRPLPELLSQLPTNTGLSLLELSNQAPVLVVLLRHFGCTFCKEALADLARLRPQIEAQGTQIVLVHLAESDEKAKALFARYQLDDLPRISDPTAELYRALGLRRGRLTQLLLNPRVWWRGWQATRRGHLVGPLVGDGFRMPGVFLIDRGEIVKAYRHPDASATPDYVELASCPVSTGVESVSR